MELNISNYSSLLMFLAGGILLLTGLIYKIRPPKKLTWYNAMQLKTARSSVETWREAIRYSATPLIFSGLLLIAFGILPFVFNYGAISFSTGIMLIMGVCLGLVSRLNNHINKLYDEKGIEK